MFQWYESVKRFFLASYEIRRGLENKEALLYNCGKLSETFHIDYRNDSTLQFTLLDTWRNMGIC